MSQEVLSQLQSRFGKSIIETTNFRGDDTALVNRTDILAICEWLESAPGMEFNMVMDICGVDYPDRGDERFEVVYHLYSTKQAHRIRLKVRVPESDPFVDSVVKVWVGANWFEREAFDLFGIKFRGHPNLKRLLTFEEFEGHPLRKDFPVNKRPKIPTPDTML